MKTLDGPVWLTFAEFQGTRRDGVLRDLLAPVGIDIYDAPEAQGSVYADRLYIGIVDHPQGKYELVLGNRDWLTDDRAKLERLLYDFACAEGYVRDPDTQADCGHARDQYDPEHRECKACAAIARSVEDA
jgi:hypothetical protein